VTSQRTTVVSAAALPGQDPSVTVPKWRLLSGRSRLEVRADMMIGSSTRMIWIDRIPLALRIFITKVPVRL